MSFLQYFRRGMALAATDVYTRSQHQKGLNVFGWVAPLAGWHGMMKWARGNTDGLLRILKSITMRFQGKIIDLWVDRARWHRGERVEIFRREHRQVHLHYLPAYHPELNYQESLWRTLRYEETTNAFFETLEILGSLCL